MDHAKYLRRKQRIMEWKIERKEKEVSKEAYARSSTSESFYKSALWHRLRFQAFEIHGRKCHLCGNTPEHGAILQVDHIRPRYIYPELACDITNLQILCKPCNAGKGIQTRDYRPKTILRKKLL